MIAHAENMMFGPYRMVRPLGGDEGMAERWLALHERQSTSHVVYRFRELYDKMSRRRFLAWMERLSALRHPHLLPIEEYSFCPTGRACFVTPYTGNQDGLVTLDVLLHAKGGRLGVSETQRGIRQMLDAMRYIHSLGSAHGPVDPAGVQVDRSGRLVLELRGEWAVDHPCGSERDDVRAVVALAFRMMTGVTPERAGRTLAELAPDTAEGWTPAGGWEAWFRDGLDPLGGFASAGEALATLPDREVKALDPDAAIRSGTAPALLAEAKPSRARGWISRLLAPLKV